MKLFTGRQLSVIVLLLMPLFTVAQQLRWKMATDGGITWNVQQGNSHQDHIEMSGRQLSAIIRYGNDKTGQLVLKRKLVFPMLRTIPNNTHGSLIQTMDRNIIDSLRVNGQLIQEVPTSFHINGYLQSTSTTNGGITIQRRGFPSTDKAAYIEQYTITNTQPSPLNIDIPETALQVNTDAAKGVYGTYVIEYKVYDGGQVVLPPAGSYSFSVVISGRKATDNAYTYSAAYEWDKRSALVTALQQSLVLQTPDDTLNRMFTFAKVRFAESIFDTKGGLMHAPGGGAYYAAIWANDQAEYANPLFPFLGYAEGNESARNSFRLFAKFMNPEYRPIPSSIIAEGTDVWNGAGDRGDQAMIAYGASLFALYGGDTTEARRLWPLISWCNEYLRRKKTSSGVIPSDSDEMEGRFKAGKINLSTNVLAYGGLVYGSRLARALGQEQEAIRLQAEATQLEKDIDTYFGATVEGYNTYQYYEGNTTLRAWISAPLAMGLLQRKEQTIRALLSEKLWTKDGILTESGSETFWDRSALYAFKGMFKAGATALALPYFKYYSSQRLLGDHVPYAIEAWPEGDQRHLAAESGLYARVITEGMFGIDPISFSSFKVFPQLPAAWKEMALRNIRAFNHNFDLRVVRAGKVFTIEVSANGKITQRIKWDGKAPVSITL